MQIIIDIPEDVYNSIKSNEKIITYVAKNGGSNGLQGSLAIINGIILPKGHGRLIDADSLIKAIEEKAKRLSNADTINGLCGAVALIYDEQAIIEAEKWRNNGSNKDKTV